GDGQAPSCLGAVVQEHGGGLIIVLQHGGIMFHHRDGPQFDRVAFKLNGAPHFVRSIGPADIAGLCPDTACWRRHAELGQQGTGGRRQGQPTAPSLELRGSQHRLPSCLWRLTRWQGAGTAGQGQAWNREAATSQASCLLPVLPFVLPGEARVMRSSYSTIAGKTGLTRRQHRTETLGKQFFCHKGLPFLSERCAARTTHVPFFLPKNL